MGTRTWKRPEAGHSIKLSVKRTKMGLALVLEKPISGGKILTTFSFEEFDSLVEWYNKGRNK